MEVMLEIWQEHMDVANCLLASGYIQCFTHSLTHKISGEKT